MRFGGRILVAGTLMWLGYQQLQASGARIPKKTLGEKNLTESSLRVQGPLRSQRLDSARAPAEGITQQIEKLAIPSELPPEPDLSDVSPEVMRAPPSKNAEPSMTFELYPQGGRMRYRLTWVAPGSVYEEAGYHTHDILDEPPPPPEDLMAIRVEKSISSEEASTSAEESSTRAPSH